MKRLIYGVLGAIVMNGCLPANSGDIPDDAGSDTAIIIDSDTTQGDTETETETETDSSIDTGTETESEETCVNSPCETHADCICQEEAFCVPDLAGVDVFWDILTCTLDCTDDPSICQTGYHCVEIPAFVDGIYPDVFPGSLCAANEEELDTDSDTDEIIELEWVEIPGGSFEMGFGVENGNELPVHTVNLPDFQMLKTEVTVAQYRDCVDDGVCSKPGSGVNATWPGRTNHPVNYVDWFQAKDFCEYVGGNLPSESQWEYAATNAGQPVLYPWGNSEATCEMAVIKEDGDGCGTGSTMSVCSKSEGNTVQGLCDMSGNVWEWIQDWYHDSYNGAPNDGTSWESPEGTVRITRGGAFSYDGSYNVRFRNDHADPTIQFQSDGFRCVK